MLINGKTLQTLMAYGAIVMSVLTQALAGVHLPAIASGVLGVFGILLHPNTSITAPASEVKSDLSAAEAAALKMIGSLVPKDTPTS
jgi:hypothetical protein